MQNTYAIQDTDLFLGTGNKKYILKIRDLPPQEKPREKMINIGPDALSVAELIAVVLGVGTRKEEVLHMANRIIKEYGEKSFVSQKNIKAMADDLDIPESKAAQLVACAELGRRFFKKNENLAPTIRSAEDIHAYVKDMATLNKEHLRGIYLNSHRKVIHDEVVSIGTVSTNIVHPREVFKPAIEYLASAVVLVHNHPSGELVPSAADIEVTEKLIEAGKIFGIELLDHVIVAKGGYTSIKVDYKGE